MKNKFKIVFPPEVLLKFLKRPLKAIERSSKGTRMNRMKHPGFILQTGVGMLEL